MVMMVVVVGVAGVSVNIFVLLIQFSSETFYIEFETEKYDRYVLSSDLTS